MKTKSYTIYVGDPAQNRSVTVSETVSQTEIKLSIAGGGVILLSHEAWKELMRTEYHLTCHEVPTDQAVAESKEPTDDVG